MTDRDRRTDRQSSLLTYLTARSNMIRGVLKCRPDIPAFSCLQSGLSIILKRKALSVASLRLVSPGAVTDDVTFFTSKSD